MRVFDPHLTAAIAGLTHENAGHRFQRITKLIKVTFLKCLAIDDIHIAARAIVGLFRDNIAKRIFECAGDLNILCCIRS